MRKIILSAVVALFAAISFGQCPDEFISLRDQQDVDNFTEYNFLGAYCWKYHHDLYEWVDIADEKSEWLDIPFMQEYSHQDSFDKEKLIVYLLSVPGVYLWMVDVIAAGKKNGCNLYGINPDHYGFNRNMELRELYKGLLHIAHPHVEKDWPK